MSAPAPVTVQTPIPRVGSLWASGFHRDDPQGHPSSLYKVVAVANRALEPEGYELLIVFEQTRGDLGLRGLGIDWRASCLAETLPEFLENRREVTGVQVRAWWGYQGFGTSRHEWFVLMDGPREKIRGTDQLLVRRGERWEDHDHFGWVSMSGNDPRIGPPRDPEGVVVNHKTRRGDWYPRDRVLLGPFATREEARWAKADWAKANGVRKISASAFFGDDSTDYNY